MDKQMDGGSDYNYIPATSITSGISIELLPDIFCSTIQIVNIVLVGKPNANDFVLVDAGMPKSAEKIVSIIEERFGEERKPKAIILTHGHFDHVGAVIDLIERWKIPVFAHEFELPFLTGRQRYPEPDPSVEGGVVAKMSAMFPVEPIDLGENIKALPSDGSVPFLSEFRW